MVVVYQAAMEKDHGVPQKSIQNKKWKRINGLVVTAFVQHLKVLPWLLVYYNYGIRYCFYFMIIYQDTSI